MDETARAVRPRKGRPPTRETLAFTLELLKRIPRGRKISTTDLCEQLRAAGWDRDVRTVQRQLDELSRHFDIERDERSKPFGYQWKTNSAGLSLPGLTEKEALVLALAQQQLRALLPPTVAGSMAPFFEQAQARLAVHPHQKPHDRAASEWLRKVRFISNSQPLLAPEMQGEVLDTVSKALWHDEWLDITYRNSGGKTIHGRVMPLGMAQQDERLYLVCRFEGHEDDRTLAVHRILSVSASSIRFQRPKNFDLETFDKEGRFAFGNGALVDLEFLITKVAGLHLLESRLSEDQRSSEEGDCYRIRARVPATQRLTWWLRSFGDDVKVLAPVDLALAVQPRGGQVGE